MENIVWRFPFRVSVSISENLTTVFNEDSDRKAARLRGDEPDSSTKFTYSVVGKLKGDSSHETTSPFSAKTQRAPFFPALTLNADCAFLLATDSVLETFRNCIKRVLFNANALLQQSERKENLLGDIKKEERSVLLMKDATLNSELIATFYVSGFQVSHTV